MKTKLNTHKNLNKGKPPKNTGSMVVLVVYPRDSMAKREKWLAAAAQHHERMLHCVL